MLPCASVHNAKRRTRRVCLAPRSNVTLGARTSSGYLNYVDLQLALRDVLEVDFTKLPIRSHNSSKLKSSPPELKRRAVLPPKLSYRPKISTRLSLLQISPNPKDVYCKIRIW